MRGVSDSIFGVRSMDNEGRWIKVTNFYTGKRVAINLNYVVSVRENHDAQEIYNGKRSMIDLTDGSYFSCHETFDEIEAMIK